MWSWQPQPDVCYYYNCSHQKSGDGQSSFPKDPSLEKWQNYDSNSGQTLFGLETEEIDTSSVQFSSVAQLCPTLCDPMNHITPGLPVHHQLPEFTQTHIHRGSEAIQPSHPLSSPSPPASNPSQHQGLFQWVNSVHEVAKVLEFQPQHQSFRWTPRTGLL